MASDQPAIRPDVEAAKGRMATTFGGRRELRQLHGHLLEGELVRLMATGRYFGGGQGLLVLTDRRLIFIRHGLLSKTAEEIPLGLITLVLWADGTLLGKIFVFATGPDPVAEVNDVDKADGKAIVDAIRDHQARELAEQHARSVLTDEEYGARVKRMRNL